MYYIRVVTQGQSIFIKKLVRKMPDNKKRCLVKMHFRHSFILKTEEIFNDLKQISGTNLVNDQEGMNYMV